ncbi:hypothetical protein GCM10020220_111080 [Nonomuraea rubra]
MDVLDLRDARRPRKVATLTTPAPTGGPCHDGWWRSRSRRPTKTAAGSVAFFDAPHRAKSGRSPWGRCPTCDAFTGSGAARTSCGRDEGTRHGLVVAEGAGRNDPTGFGPRVIDVRAAAPCAHRRLPAWNGKEERAARQGRANQRPGPCGARRRT